jgi:hypothetical protein
VLLVLLVLSLSKGRTLTRREIRFATREVVVVIRACRSVAVVLVLLAGVVLFNVASPAWACGCGAYVPENPGS